jgi:hypothetical protein
VNLDVSLITPNGLRLSDTRRAAGTLSALEEQCRSHERRVRGGDGGLGGEGMMTNITVQCARLRAQIGRHLVAASLIVGAATMSACASGGVGTRAAQFGSSPSAVVIENNSWDRVTVYISRGDQLWRLGDVGALGRTEFPVQRLGFLADGRSTFLVAHPLAGQSFRSEQFMFPTGGVAVWTIENQSGLSHVSVR